MRSLLGCVLLVGCPTDPPCETLDCAPSGLDVTVSGDEVAGTWVDGGQRVRFQAGPGGAWFEDPDGVRVEITLSGPESSTLTVEGVTLDGDGPLTDGERAALVAFVARPLADAAATATLRLGCTDEVPAPALAALLVPLQARLKYLDADRVAALMPLVEASGCAYFARPEGPEPQGSWPTGLLLLTPDAPVPVVAATLPFDADGAVEATARAAGDLFAACDARCRGACGPSCIRTNCAVTDAELCATDPLGYHSGWLRAATTYDCGTHAGCRWHDDCYDGCHAVEGCGTWGAAVCRRACDRDACQDAGATTCASWAAGFGPFDGRLQFTYPKDAEPLGYDAAGCGVTVWHELSAPFGPTTFFDALEDCEGRGDGWRLPLLDEMTRIARGCDAFFQGCATLAGPRLDGCYLAADDTAPCDVYWSGDADIFQTYTGTAMDYRSARLLLDHPLAQQHRARCIRTR